MKKGSPDYNALCALDMAWARSKAPRLSDGGLLAGMHKARVELTSMPDEFRLESIEFLRAAGMKRYGQLPLPPVGELPE